MPHIEILMRTPSTGPTDKGGMVPALRDLSTIDVDKEPKTGRAVIVHRLAMSTAAGTTRSERTWETYEVVRARIGALTTALFLARPTALEIAAAQAAYDAATPTSP